MKLRTTFSVILLTISAVFFGLPALARELTVKSFEPVLTDLSARTNPVKDLNLDLCALIKISLPERECRFDGNVVKQSYDITEYLVYVSPGTRKFQIKYSGTETLNLDLEELLGGDEVKSGTTYRLTLSGYEDLTQDTPKKTDSGVNYLILNITPSSGVSVKIDGNPQSVDNGQTTTLLKYGNHDYVVEADGYAPVRGTATVDKSGKTILNVKLESILATLDVRSSTPGAKIKINNENKGTGSFTSTVKPGSYTVEISKEGFDTYTESFVLSEKENKKINVNLESIMATLNVKAKDNDAIIKINSQNKGKGSFSSSMMPGLYQIEVIKESHKPYSTTIELAKLENKTIEVPALTPITGMLNIEYKPSGATVSIDGKVVDTTPAVINDVLIGNRSVTISKDGYEPMTLTATVAEGGVSRLEGSLHESQKGKELFIDGENSRRMNNIHQALRLFKEGALYGDSNCANALGKLYENGDGVKKDYAEAAKWYRKAAEAGHAEAMYNLGAMYQYGLGVIKDNKEAVSWYRKAAEAGNDWAMYHLGKMYENGYGVLKSNSEAVFWFQKAAYKGNISAKSRLEELGVSY